MKKENGGLFVFGIPSLVTIFLVLALTVFSLLSLSTAEAGRKLSEKAAMSAKEWYEADAASQAILAELRAGRMPEDVEASGEVITWDISVSETLVLRTKVKISGDDYEIVYRNIFSTDEWNISDTVNVWKGD